MVKRMTEWEKRLKRCCFTGHRPEKLRGTEANVKAALTSEIERALVDGKRTFISGMARGVDIWAAELVLKYREDNSAVHLICALPFPEFGESMGIQWRERYNAVLARADWISCICPNFRMDSYQKRNIWMVNRSSRLIAVYDGEQGGTWNTMAYARRQGIEIAWIDPRGVNGIWRSKEEFLWN